MSLTSAAGAAGVVAAANAAGRGQFMASQHLNETQQGGANSQNMYR